MKKITDQDKKDLKSLDANLQKHEEELQSKKENLTEEQKLQYAEYNFEYAEKRLSEEVESYVERAASLLAKLKSEKEDFDKNDETGFYKKTDAFGGMLRTIQNAFNNFDTQDASRIAANYAKAKAVKDCLTGKRW